MFFFVIRNKIKALMDFKYFSPYTIIILIGAIGFFFNFLEAIIFYKKAKNCNKELNNDFNCYIGVLSYFKELKNKLETQTKNFYLEVIVITPSYIISEFMILTSFIFIIKYLNPIYALLSDNIYFIIYNIVFFIKKKNYYNKQKAIKFLFSEISEILEFLGFIIYLEIIELRFCGLNKNTRKNIALRGDYDYNQRITGSTLNDEDIEDIGAENDKGNAIELKLS